MKKLLKSFSVYLVVAMILSFSIFVPASAETMDEALSPVEILDGLVVDDGFIFEEAVGCRVYCYELPLGSYTIESDFDLTQVLEKSDAIGVSFPVYWITRDHDSWNGVELSSFGILDVAESMLRVSVDEVTGEELLTTAYIMVNSLGKEPVVSVAHPGVVERILIAWSDILSWFAGVFGKIMPLFYLPESGLTFCGYLAIAGVAVSVGFLFLGLVQKWLRFGR